mmetsp:Transcript_35629/g.40467  ORF Transcript_35629/g.40467 Transcript_35629/m.40467 type:complete len:299 (-) Transcript_35629:323-1219(-)
MFSFWFDCSQLKKIRERPISRTIKRKMSHYKEKGNEEFLNGNYETAVKYYTKAIETDSTVSVYFSNRARCWKLLGNWENARKDAQEAVELDETNIKAYDLYGIAELELGRATVSQDVIARGVKRLVKAEQLCASQGKRDFEPQLRRHILLGKKILWYKEQEITLSKKQHFIHYMKDTIANDTTLDGEVKAAYMEEVTELEREVQFNTHPEIPSYLCCQITLEVMNDPVINGCGMTYEKEALEAHIKQHGNFDPVTREYFAPSSVIPNLRIKQATEEFIKHNPWAFEYLPGETFDSIKL